MNECMYFLLQQNMCLEISIAILVYWMVISKLYLVENDLYDYFVIGCQPCYVPYLLGTSRKSTDKNEPILAPRSLHVWRDEPTGQSLAEPMNSPNQGMNSPNQGMNSRL